MPIIHAKRDNPMKHILLALCLLSGTAHAESFISPSPWDPPQRDEARAPSTLEPVYTDSFREGKASVNGLSYTVLTPLFLGEDNNYSYVRFPNGGTSSATVYITVVGSPSGEEYGTTFTTVASGASPQFRVTDILKTIGTPNFLYGDDSVSLYLRSPQGGNYIGFQHVVWNSLTGFFENASICTYRTDIEYTALNRVLVNVHTALLEENYPVQVFLHNYAPVFASYRADIYDSTNGAYLGAVQFNMEANSSISRRFSEIAEVINLTPTANQYHINMIFSPVTTSNYYALAAQAIDNLELQAYTNMSMICGINPS